MYPSIVEFFALVLFIGGLWHAARYQGRDFAQQWFIGAYLAALIRETLNQIIFQVYIFSPDVLRIGAAPGLITLLGAGITYIAYRFALRFVAATQPGWVAGLVFIIAASLALPIEATAAQLHWWIYNEPLPVVFGGVPIAALFVWGGSAAIFYVVFWRIRESRLPERGKFYAMVTLAPVIAVGQLLLMVLLNA